MKLFGVILLAGYFLAREQEGLLSRKEALRGLIRNTAVYWLCAGIATLVGGLSGPSSNLFQPVAILFAAVLPAIIFKGRPICFIAGAATAFCVLRLMPDVGGVAIALFSAEVAVLVLALFYEGAWRRMGRLQPVFLNQKKSAKLFLLFALAVLMLLAYQSLFFQK